MATYWTTTKKPHVLWGIDQTGITNKEAIKAILAFEKAITTTYNKILSGYSFEGVCYTDAYDRASDLFYDKLQGQAGGYGDKPEFFEEWEAYRKVVGYADGLSIDDFLC